MIHEEYTSDTYAANLDRRSAWRSSSNGGDLRLPYIGANRIESFDDTSRYVND